MVNQYNIEILAAVPDYERKYEASTRGEIRSHKRGFPHTLTGGDAHGYLALMVDKKTIRIHQLVAMTFLGHKRDGTHKIVVDHIDRNKKNNALSNLQLISHRENCTKDRKPTVGARLHKPSGKWYGFIDIDKKPVYLGAFLTEQEASDAHKEAWRNIEAGLPVVRRLIGSGKRTGKHIEILHQRD